MDAIKTQLKEILDKMSVPERRKELNLHNLKWLGRNLAIQNRNHPEFPTATHFLATLITVEGEKPFILD